MRYLLFLLLILSFLSCKENNPAEKRDSLPLPERIAKAHGIDQWNEVRELRFTFNVDRDTTHFERRWSWKPGTQQVSLLGPSDTVSYQREKLDSTLMKTDAGFINDKFWLLLPYQLDWDKKNYNYEVQERALAPISGDTLTKLTMVYGDEGGYTPGDAYDLYVGNDMLIREWTFRKGNQPDPSMTTTWEGYKSFGQLEIATEHRNPDSGTVLYFSGIEIIRE